MWNEVEAQRYRVSSQEMEHPPLTAARALSMTDWWYSYDPCEKFIRTKKHHAEDGAKMGGKKGARGEGKEKKKSDPISTRLNESK